MSNPNPALVAAAPVLLNVVTELQTFFTTVLTGDPALIPQRVDAASKILLGNIELQLPGLVTAEISVVQSELNAKLTSWATSLKTMSVPAAGAPTT
jgi:hypothetical protein